MYFRDVLFSYVNGRMPRIHAVEAIHAVAKVNELSNHRLAGQGADYYLIPTVEILIRLDQNELSIFDAGQQAVTRYSKPVGIWIIAMDIKVSVTLVRGEVKGFKVTFIGQLRVAYDTDAAIFGPADIAADRLSLVFGPPVLASKVILRAHSPLDCVRQ